MSSRSEAPPGFAPMYTRARVPGVEIVYEDREGTSGRMTAYSFVVVIEGVRYGLLGLMYAVLDTNGEMLRVPGLDRYAYEIKGVSTSAPMYDRRSRLVIPTTRDVPSAVYPYLASVALQIFSNIDLGPRAILTKVAFSPKEAIEPETYELDLGRLPVS